ncbi:MAG: heavy metal-binding domain-containing protein [Elusimicrobia bacterium]|nr:heavy metal-binding domain-containing protein [Elusimicrobiota bacterium]
MNKILMSAAVILALGASAAYSGDCPMNGKAAQQKPAAAKHKCDDCDMHKKAGAKKCAGMTCPEKLDGAKTSAKNIENGVEITVTSSSPEVAEHIQELALVHYNPKAEKCQDCPTAVPGAKTDVQNTSDGIKVTVTGKDPVTVRKIQEASAKEHPTAEALKPAKAAKKVAMVHRYVCPMGDYEGDKPGKCPKCGMQLKEKN